MNVYNLELVRNNEIRNYVTHKQDVLSVYCLHVILFDNFFFKSLMFVCLQKLLNCLIICSYKTNPSFSPCPWNLRSIGPSDFKYCKPHKYAIFNVLENYLGEHYGDFQYYKGRKCKFHDTCSSKLIVCCM